MSIQVCGVGLWGDVWVGFCEGDCASVVDHCDESLWEQAVGVGEGCSSYVSAGGGYA